MRRWGYIALIIGIALVIGLVCFQGAGDVAAAVAAVSWGIVVVVLVRLVPIMLDGYVWRLLFLKDHRPSVLTALWARWIGEAVNTLVPAFQVGGAVVRSRLMVMRGVPGRVAGASVVVDLTLSTITLLFFTLVGIGLLMAHHGESDIARAIGFCVAGGFVVVILLCVFQQRGLFGWIIGLTARFARGRAWTMPSAVPRRSTRRSSNSTGGAGCCLGTRPASLPPGCSARPKFMPRSTSWATRSP